MCHVKIDSDDCDGIICNNLLSLIRDQLKLIFGDEASLCS